MKGNRKIDAKTLLSQLDIKEGDSFSPEAIQKEIKKFYQLGYFDQIEVQSDPFEGGIALIFLFDEKPVLTSLSFEGNEAIRSESISEKLSLKTLDFVDQAAIHQEVEKIVRLYEKEAYYQAEVVPVLDHLSKEKATLTFMIREGKKAHIRHIQFSGASAFKEEELAKAIQTKEYFWLTSWFTESGRYQKDQIEEDRDRLRDFYLDNGYLLVQVQKPQITPSEEKKTFDITFPVVEGDRLSIAEVSYSGNQLFDNAKLATVTKSRVGAFFSKKQVQEDIRQITDLYGEQGHLFANVSPQVLPNTENKKVDLAYQISEGTPYRIREINIEGNDKTRDKVIRREMRQNEQEQINTVLLRRSYQRIHNLNFFENIDIVPKKVSDEEVDLNVSVTEKSTGSFIAGAGYSSVDRLVGQLEINNGNLFGKGQLLRVRSELGERRTTYSMTFREPYLLDSTFSGTVDLFNQVRTFNAFNDFRENQYQEKRVGGSLIVGKSFGEYFHASVSHTRENLLLFDVGANAPALIQDQARLGETQTHALGFSMTRDTRDFIFDPKQGAKNTLSLEHAGTFLGGDNDYYKVTVDSGRFFPSILTHVVSLHGHVGFADGVEGKTLPVGERFFVGGINSVRGFRFGRAGPITESGVVKGGNKALFMNLEYLIPLVPEAGLKAVFFYDYGSAFDDDQAIRFRDLREGVGAGIRWISPLGPLRFEWGRNIHPQSGESDREFEFSIGTLF
jgi:outer membrane protein insertion porin family